MGVRADRCREGVYDLFHFGWVVIRPDLGVGVDSGFDRHALQLRQAKLAFPSVYLLVGVNSDELVRQHKSRSVMNHAERCVSILCYTITQSRRF